MSVRIEKIRAMLADDPQDTFLRYSLAMECRGLGQTDEATSLFRGLMGDSPPHVQAFFMLAQMEAENGRVEPARETLRNGIDQARLQNDAHAAAEMSELLASLGSLGESEFDGDL